MSIKAKQVAGVTTLVIVVVLIMSGWQMATLMRLRLEQTNAGAELLADAIFQRAFAVASAEPADPYTALREDGGIRSILLASIAYTEGQNILYTAVVRPNGEPIVHSSPEYEGQVMPEQEDFEPIVQAGPIAQAMAVYSERRFEVRRPILSGEQLFGVIRVGVSTLLVRDEIMGALWRAGQTAVVALVLSTLVAIAAGAVDAASDPRDPERSDTAGPRRARRDARSARAGIPRPRDLVRCGQRADSRRSGRKAVPSSTEFESVMENLEDAVALFSPEGDLMFSNASMRMLLPALAADDGHTRSAVSRLASDHPVRQLVERSLAGRKAQGPVSIALGSPVEGEQEPPERLLLCHAIEDSSGRFLGAMLVARNVGYLTHVHTTLNYSRKLAALGRLMAGVAHEVKNPLNAMTIHLELLKQKLTAARESIAVPAGVGTAVTTGRPVDMSKHVNVIADEIKRLDQVVVGFLKFARPDELKLQPVHLASLVSEVVSMTAPDAERRNIAIKTECPSTLPEINADPGMLQQALLNLALNACQAMPDGGTLRIACRAAARRRVELDVEDTGVGIPPENLGRIFDLYFTTKEKGSGIGLSMVFRIVQLHDGEVEVQSTPGRGTTLQAHVSSRRRIGHTRTGNEENAD